jgi:hypothetical protein
MGSHFVLSVSFCVLLIWAGHAFAQEDSVPKPTVPRTAQPRAESQVVMPNAEKIVLLLRNTLITLNDAIQTGNFTVLRDRGAPGFREANTPARLSQAFNDLASKFVDLSAVSIIAPQLTEPPVFDQQNGMLRLKGFFPGQPVRIDFDIIYQAVAGRWMLFGLSVQPAESRPEASIGSPPAAVPSKKIVPKKPLEQKPAQAQ